MVKIGCERLEQYFVLNKLDEEQKTSLLLISIDNDLCKMLHDLCHPNLQTTKTYDQLIILLHKQLVVWRSVCRERLTFYSTKQETNETVAIFFTRIKAL